MLGFKLTGPNVAEQCNDGEVVRLQPDVRLVLGMLAEMNLPPIESLGAQGARDFVDRIQQGPSCRPAGRRGRRRRAAGRRRSAALSSLSAGDAGAASDRGLFPWRRLGARRRAVRRSVLPRHVPPQRDDRRQRRLPPCARASLPGGGRGRLCGDALDRRARGRARRQAGPGAGRRLERRRQYRRRHLPAGARSRRPADRGPAPGMPGHRLQRSTAHPTPTMRPAIS